MKVAYVIAGILLLGSSYIFYYMTTLPWAADIAYGYVASAILGTMGLITLYSVLFVKIKKEE